MNDASKMLLPYRKWPAKTSGDCYYRRFTVGPARPNLAIYVYYTDYGWSGTCENKAFDLDIGYASKEAAMEDLDKALVNQGYILLTEEQAKKIEILM